MYQYVWVHNTQCSIIPAPVTRTFLPFHAKTILNYFSGQAAHVPQELPSTRDTGRKQVRNRYPKLARDGQCHYPCFCRMVAVNNDTCMLISVRDSLQDSFMFRTALHKVARTFLAEARRCHPCFHSPSSRRGARSSLRPHAVTCRRPPPADKQGRVHRTGLAVSMRQKQGCVRCAPYSEPFLPRPRAVALNASGLPCDAALASGPTCGCLSDGQPKRPSHVARPGRHADSTPPSYGSGCRWHRPLVVAAVRLAAVRLAAGSVRTHLVTTPWPALARACSPDEQKSSTGQVARDFVGPEGHVVPQHAPAMARTHHRALRRFR